MKNIINLLFIASNGILANGEKFSLTEKENLQVLQKLIEYGDEKAIANMSEFFAETVRVHNTQHPEGKEYSLEEITKGEAERIAVLLGKEWKVLDLFVMGDIVVSYVQMHGIHVGEFVGLPATRKEFSTPIVFIYRFSNGRICEVWNIWDRMSVAKQLGEVHVAIPSD